MCCGYAAPGGNERLYCLIVDNYFKNCHNFITQSLLIVNYIFGND